MFTLPFFIFLSCFIKFVKRHKSMNTSKHRYSYGYNAITAVLCLSYELQYNTHPLTFSHRNLVKHLLCIIRTDTKYRH